MFISNFDFVRIILEETAKNRLPSERAKGMQLCFYRATNFQTVRTNTTFCHLIFKALILFYLQSN